MLRINVGNEFGYLCSLTFVLIIGLLSFHQTIYAESNTQLPCEDVLLQCPPNRLIAPFGMLSSLSALTVN